MIFSRISNRFQLKYKDRESAGNILGEALKQIIKKEERENSLVLGIPRGGIIIADRIANKLNCKLDIILSRKLRAPNNEEVAIGAIMEDGTTYLNEIMVKGLGIDLEYIEKEKLEQLQEIKRRASLYCSLSSTITGCDKADFTGKTIILADDGAATGATIIIASRFIRSKKPNRIIAAIPIAPKATLDLLKTEAIDHVEVLTSPANINFKSIDQFYRDFHQLSDKQVVELLGHDPKNLE